MVIGNNESLQTSDRLSDCVSMHSLQLVASVTSGNVGIVALTRSGAHTSPASPLTKKLFS